MTTIATDGKTMAADSRQKTSYVHRVACDKLRRLSDGSIAGFTGDLPLALQRMQWMEDGADPDKFPQGRGDDSATILVLRPDGRVERYEDYPVLIEVGAPAAIGGGLDFAMGAMMAGATSVEAVEIAAMLDPGTGGAVYEMEPRKGADE